jgi:uncharacterized delta-60 repeat protein
MMRSALALVALSASNGYCLGQNPGDLDPSFGVGGIVITNFRSAVDIGRDVAIQPDGHFAVSGTNMASIAGPDQGFLVARFKPDGSADSTFSDDGWASTHIGGGYGEARGIALQPDGKIVAAGISLGVFYGDLTLARYHPHGDLDSTFGTDGIVALELGQVEEAWDVAIQPDGKIVALGSYRNPIVSADDFLLVRYDSNGTLDTTFGSGGMVITDFGTNIEIGYSLALQVDGKIVVAGVSYVNGFSSFMSIGRYLPNGTLDSSFGGDGRVPVAVGQVAIARSVAIQANGRIVLGGLRHSGDFDFAAVRLLADGTLDNTFSNDGIDVQQFTSEFDGCHDVLVQADQKILLVGRADAGASNDNFALLRYASDGTLDNSFGSGGKLVTAFGPHSDGAYAVAVQPDARIVAVGWANDGTNDDIALARYHPGGTLDISFDNDGKVTMDIGSPDAGFAVGIKLNGDIVVGGVSDSNFAVARYHKPGNLDNFFSSDGKVTSDFSGYYDEIRGVALSIDDKITVAGSNGNGTSTTFALARYNTFGTLDNSFSGDGKLTTTIGTSSGAAAVLLQPNGRIVASGFADMAGTTDFAAMRCQGNGTLDNSFDVDGKVTTDFALALDAAHAMLLQPDGKLVVVGESQQDLALIRYNANGSLDNAFGSAGKVVSTVGAADIGFATALQSNGHIVVAGSSDGDILVARYTPTGYPDSTFHGDGFVTTSVGNSNAAHAVAVQPDGKIVVAGTSDKAFLVVRYQPGGNLDSTFGNYGSVRVTIRAAANAHGIALQPDGKIVVAGESLGDFAMIRLMGLPCTATSGSTTVSACVSYTSPSGNQTWTTSGVYHDTLFNEQGCDSILTINLTIFGPDTSVSLNLYTLTASASPATYQWINCTTNTPIGGQTGQSYTPAATGYYAVIVTQNGCSDTSNCWNAGPCHTQSNVTVSACKSYESPSGQYTWTSSGAYNDTIPNASGCDSFLTIYLTVIKPDTSVLQTGNTLTAVANGVSYQWINCTGGTPIAGATGKSFTPTTNGHYAVIVTLSGCSDTSNCHFVDLCGVTYGNINQTECFSFTSPSGNHVWTESGTYQDTLLNVSGCDSFITVYLTINGPDLNVTLAGHTLTSATGGAYYQWIDCSNGAVLHGANSQSFTPAANGSYAVIVALGPCVDTSDCYTVTGVGMAGLQLSVFNAYPNPTTGDFRIQLEAIARQCTVEIKDSRGRLVSVSNRYNTDLLYLTITGPAGLYFVTVRSDATVRTLAVVKD